MLSLFNGENHGTTLARLKIQLIQYITASGRFYCPADYTTSVGSEACGNDGGGLDPGSEAYLDYGDGALPPAGRINPQLLTIIGPIHTNRFAIDSRGSTRYRLTQHIQLPAKILQKPVCVPRDFGRLK